MSNEFQERIEDDHAWFIFGGISLRGAKALWNISDLGREASAESLFGKGNLEDAGVIGGAIQMSIPSLLLAGFGFESLLKGILLRQMSYRGDPLTTTKGGKAFLVRSLKTHNLTALATKAGIRLDVAETALLDRLTTIVTWAGRYPVSIGEEGLVPGAGEFGPGDGKAVSGLAARLFKIADETPRLVETGPKGERLEMVKEADEWKARWISDGKTAREFAAKRSPDAFTKALEWMRELKPPKSSKI
jgi:hypothetical protein